MPIDLTRVQGLCFDIDGTLRDTDDQMVHQLTSMLRPGGWGMSQSRAEALARRFVMGIENPGTYLHGVLDRLGLDQVLANIMDGLSRIQRGSKLDRLRIIAGAREMLAVLFDRYPMAVVSARSAHSTQAFLDEHRLNQFFKVVVTSQTCRYTKPFPEPVLYAAQVLGVPAANCLMVGDTTADIQAGRAAGAQTVGVLCGFGEEDELVRAGADLILPKTPDLVDYLLLAPD